MANVRPERKATLFVLDVLAYVLVVDVFVFCLAVVGEAVLGGQWVIVEEIMFVAGVLLFGYATLSLWPTSIEDEEESRMDDYTPDGRVQRVANTLPLLPYDSSPRLPEGVKLFLASIVVVLTAFLIERLFIV
jgi:hypothetical protein